MIWVLCIALALVVSAGIMMQMVRPQSVEKGVSTDPKDVSFYKEQLAEIERDLERGVLNADEAERTRVEVARRLLRADAQAFEAADVQGPAPMGVTVLTGAFVMGLGLLLYSQLGTPQAQSFPHAQRVAGAAALRAERPNQQAMEDAYKALSIDIATPTDEEIDLITRLRAVVAQNPDEVQGWIYLRNFELSLSNFAAAAAAQGKVVGLLGDDAPMADKSYLLSLVVAAAGGRVSPEAEGLARTLLAEDGENLTARYYIGLMYAQTDRPDIAFRAWKPLAEGGDPTEPHVIFARERIEEAAFRAGVNYQLPALSGPSAADVAASEDMSDEDRDEMIRGMVSQLSNRLATEGGPATEWARLIRAYGVLGDVDQARDIWTESKQVFAESPADLDALDAAAIAAGVQK